MKALLWILLGLVVGAFGMLSAINALRPATAFPKGVMALFQHHLGAARDQVSAGTCDAKLAAHVEALAVIARDVRPAFLPIGEGDEQFGRYADQLLGTAQQALTQDLSNCTVAAEQVGLIGDGCKACHREFK